MDLLAQLSNPAVQLPGGTTSGEGFIGLLLPGLVSFGVVIAGVIFLVLLALGAVQWITSGADKSAIEASRIRIRNALIGIIVVFCLFAIVNLFGCFFGIDPTRITIGELDIAFGTSPLCPAGSQLTCEPPCGPCNSCINNTCVYNAQGCSVCNPACTAGFQCVNATCIPVSPDLCNPPCNPGETCINNVCVVNQSPGGTGTCQCDLWNVVSSQCTSPSQATCTGNFSCVCVGGGTCSTNCGCYGGGGAYVGSARIGQMGPINSTGGSGPCYTCTSTGWVANTAPDPLYCTPTSCTCP